MKNRTAIIPRLILGAVLTLGTSLACAAGPNLVIIGWDTLRADRLGALGYGRNVTPGLDALAGKSVLFTNAVSQAGWTLPSFMSVFTGLYPSEHGVTNKYLPPAGGDAPLVQAALSTSTLTLAEALKRGGYRTAAFTGGAGLGASYGFSRGFDVYSEARDFAGFGETFPPALEWLRKNRGAPFFLFIHGYDTHPYHPLPAGKPYKFVRREDRRGAAGLRARHEELRSAQLEGRRAAPAAADLRLWTDVYDEKVLGADRLLGAFLRDFDALASTDTVLILLSDHGEELFDHGGVDHGMTLYDEIIRVPLLVRAPGLEPARIAAQVRLIDVFPTAAGLLDLELSPAERDRLSGTDLFGAGKGAALDAFAETDYLHLFSKRVLKKSAGMKLSADGVTGERELYDTSEDPRERKNLFGEDPARDYGLELELFDFGNRLRPAP
ncbi:MAG TPA: hypothetical protein DEQ38_00860 [Elusimicrobia bacterium]|nr:MAG: hypothetical protein A2089_09895 [Elusimicrobia bacterium GWD2_63_28]HCC46661.1 hypothetical protein [Elusimicrobiota bacterium]